MNFVADELANMSLPHSLALVYFEQAPTSYKQLLLSVISKISQPRDIIL